MGCEKMLFDHQDDHETSCGDDPKHDKALRARALAREGKWGSIVRGVDAGGTRDFLDGRPIHCGAGLELQVTEQRSDDYGEFTVWVQKGCPVRYEMDPGKRGVLYADVGGVSFTKRLDDESWLRFRWPARNG